MKYYPSLKTRAQRLRSKGKTYSEIQGVLKTKIPKSTLSYWCKSVKLPKFYRAKIEKLDKTNLGKARAMALVANKIKRWKYLESLLERNLDLLKGLDTRTQKIILSVLYLAEGAKHKSTRVLLLGSSNPKIIKFYLSLLHNCFNIDKQKFRTRVQCRFDQDVKKLEKYWQKATGLNASQFYPTYKDKRTKGKKTKKKNYMGVCIIHYFNTEIQLELELLANAIMDKITDNQVSKIDLISRQLKTGAHGATG